MSHFFTVALIPSDVPADKYEEYIGKIMEPFKEGSKGTYRSQYNDDSKWDYWLIGGRWSGIFEPDYDPEKDPANQEPCRFCAGTGGRATPPNSGPGDYPCNGCNATGTAVKWPSFWVQRGNSAPASPDLPAPFAFITPDSEWIERGKMGWWGIVTDESDESEWKAHAKAVYEKYHDHIAVALDCHI